MGTLFGGRFADYTVRKYIAERGRRVPEDRLHSIVWSISVFIPIPIAIYGWSLEKKFGGPEGRMSYKP